MYEFFETLKNSIFLLKDICVCFVTNQSKVVYSKIVAVDYEKLQYDIIFNYNRLCEKIGARCLTLYNTNSIVSMVVDAVHYSFFYFYAIIQLRKIEPLAINWSCVSALTKSYTNYKVFSHKYNEVYEIHRKMCIEDITTIYSNLYDAVVSVVNAETSIVECLLTYKQDDKYIHRVSNPDKNLFQNAVSKITLDESEVRFLDIEYHSSDYLKPIVFELDKSAYLVNNEILSAVFIKRMLEYQMPYHTFNDNYTIVLLDNNLKTVSLKFGEYVVLHKTYYTIMNGGTFKENIYSKNENEIRSQEPSKETIFRETFDEDSQSNQ
jgi:hypothetical protein